MWIRRQIQKSLNIKVFLVTNCMLMLVGLVIYGIVLVAMPNTYQTVVGHKIEGKLDLLKRELESVKMEDVGEVLNDFALSNYANVTMTDSEGKPVMAIGKKEKVAAVTTTITDEKVGSGTKEKQGKESEKLEGQEANVENQDFKYTIKMVIPDQSHEEKKEVVQWIQDGDAFKENIKLKDSPETYAIQVTNSQVVVRQASEILIQILPWVVGIMFLISTLAAYFYAAYITKPIKAVSQTAQRMSTLDLTCAPEVKRQDEIGSLSQSLNEMALKLSSTLTELEEANQSLEEDIQKEREMEQRRRTFFAAVSHELKTPITIIKGQLEGMIYKVGAYKDRDHYLKSALEVTVQMEDMVKEILSISRLGNSQFKLKKERISLVKLVESCMEEERSLAKEKNIELHELEVVGIDEKDEVEIDVKLIRRVITNLISNGIHHSPEEASIFCKVAKDERGICFCIENTGTHIPEEEMKHLFEAFYRLDQSRNRHTGGTGLGLYIVKLILEMHGYSYVARNSEKGVIFEINFKENTNKIP